jgi:hypothetical protein
MNMKGGMNDEEFERYINNTIIPLFPDMEDTPGKHVLLKVDSGPSRNCLVNSADYTSSQACPMLPPCSRRQTAITVSLQESGS